MASFTKRIRWRKILYGAGIALGLALLAQQAWQGARALQQTDACVAHPSYLLIVAACYIGAYFIQMAAWALIMRSLRAPLPAHAVIEGYALAFLPRYIPGTVWGYLSRNEWLAQNHQVSYGVSTAASVLEAGLLLGTAVWLGAYYWFPTLWQPAQVQVVLVALGVTGLWLIWRITPWLATMLAARSKKGAPELPPPGSLPRRKTLTTLTLTVITAFLYLLFWGLQGAGLVAIANTLCGGMTLSPWAAIAAAALAWSIGFLILFVPAGLGVREWSMGALLVTFATLPAGQATLIAVISRFGLIVAEVVVLLIGLHAQISHRWQRWSSRRWSADDASLE